MAPPVVCPRADVWIDLVHHTLAHLPVAPDDASSLHNDRYIRWAETRLPRPNDARRTLRQDAERLATLYNATDAAHRLQGFASLHPDLDSFLASVRFGVDQTGWPDGRAAQSVRALATELGAELVELFRIALWGETQAGFVSLHAGLQPQVRAAAEELCKSLAQLQPRLSGLGDADWHLSYPLGRSGRLTWDPGIRRPKILVGVPDPTLGVPPWAPLLQGVHEFLLWSVHKALLQHTAEATARDTRPGRPGWSTFFGSELVTLCLDCRVLSQGETAEPLQQWLARFFPDGEADLRPQLAAAGFAPGRPCPDSSDGFVRWLTTGAVLPDSLQAPFHQVVDQLQRPAPGANEDTPAG